jgi:hypothetical protein
MMQRVYTLGADLRQELVLLKMKLGRIYPPPSDSNQQLQGITLAKLAKELKLPQSFLQ